MENHTAPPVRFIFIQFWRCEPMEGVSCSIFLNLGFALRLMVRPFHSECTFNSSFTQVLLTTLNAIRSIISICILLFFDAAKIRLIFCKRVAKTPNHLHVPRLTAFHKRFINKTDYDETKGDASWVFPPLLGRLYYNSFRGVQSGINYVFSECLHFR